MLEVSYAGEIHEVNAIAGCPCGANVFATHLNRQAVRIAVYHKLRNTQWQTLTRIRPVVTLRDLARRSAEKFTNGVIARTQVVPHGEICDRCLRGDANDANARFFSRSRPQSKMAACRMPYDGDEAQIQRHDLAGDDREMIDAVRHVIERSGPAGTGCAEPAILEIPGSESAARNIRCKRRRFVATVRHSPKSAVQHANHRRPRRIREMQIALLRDVGTVLQRYNRIFCHA